MGFFLNQTLFFRNPSFKLTPLFCQSLCTITHWYTKKKEKRRRFFSPLCNVDKLISIEFLLCWHAKYLIRQTADSRTRCCHSLWFVSYLLQKYDSLGVDGIKPRFRINTRTYRKRFRWDVAKVFWAYAHPAAMQSVVLSSWSCGFAFVFPVFFAAAASAVTHAYCNSIMR